MAVYDQSYRPWTGKYTPRLWRVWAMVEIGVFEPLKSLWILLVVILAFTIVVGWLLVLFFAASQQMIPAFVSGNNVYREGFYNYPLFSMILMVLSATVGGLMISRDLRYNALLLYFSRAITRIDYVAGKFLTLALFLLFVTLGPGLLLFLGQFGMAGEKLTFGQRLGDLGAITLHSLILVVPMSAAVLAFSSLTKRAAVAAILWAAFFFSGWAFGTILENVLKSDWPRMLNWMNLTAHLGNLCYPARGPMKPVLQCGWEEPLAILAGVTLLSLGVVYRRVGSVEARE